MVISVAPSTVFVQIAKELSKDIKVSDLLLAVNGEGTAAGGTTVGVIGHGQSNKYFLV